MEVARRTLTDRGSPAKRRAPGRRPRPAPRAPSSLLSPPRASPPPGATPATGRGLVTRGPAPLQPGRCAPPPCCGTGNGYEALSPPRFLLSHCLPGNDSSVGSQLSGGGRSSRSRSHQRVLPGPPLRRRPAASRPPSGPSAGRGPAARGEQPRALLSGLGRRVLRGASFPACCPVAAGPGPSAAAMGTDSRAAGALLARASTLHLQTGNLLNWGRLRKKCPSTHSEEVRVASVPPETRCSRGRPRGPDRAAPRGGEAPGGEGGWSGSVRAVVAGEAHTWAPPAGGGWVGCRRDVASEPTVGGTASLKIRQVHPHTECRLCQCS